MTDVKLTTTKKDWRLNSEFKLIEHPLIINQGTYLKQDSKSAWITFSLSCNWDHTWPSDLAMSRVLSPGLQLLFNWHWSFDHTTSTAYPRAAHISVIIILILQDQCSMERASLLALLPAKHKKLINPLYSRATAAVKQVTKAFHAYRKGIYCPQSYSLIVFGWF